MHTTRKSGLTRIEEEPTMSSRIAKGIAGVVKLATLAAVAATTIALAVPAPAVAATATTTGPGTSSSTTRKPTPCETAIAVSKVYSITGDVLRRGGDSAGALYFYGKAEGVIQGGCPKKD